MTIASLPPEGVMSLGLAIVATSHAPMLLLDGKLSVVAGSESFCRDFGIDPATLANRPLADIGDGEWNLRTLSSLLEATASGSASIQAYEINLNRPDKPSRRLVLNAQKLDYGDFEEERLLLSILDVTDVRLAEKQKDDLVAEKAVLLQEVQHRVANSLQIIASILLQSARRVNSDESRSHLKLAHGRVMSIAAVQQQLASTNTSDVHLHTYFKQLCRSLGASMILDPEAITIELNIDGSIAKANVSVSLGLIVTELVINSLKHAFPAHRTGKITVNYNSTEAGWVLSVADDGVGIPTDPEQSKPGLGSGIVDAMARQLEAKFTLTNNHPGTIARVRQGVK
ncbi:histidine kinase [Rhizobium sp. VS19-DR104.2]|uniref:sensor histidine kinase n=1 Tax=unclassified Rhizobium TaxID=2613769 RepID=UPI001CC48E75|nr:MULTISPECIES: histidine kinase dimerization/phosphoacceptor domain -containing protein [unclassified Rhizobium]MBZ5762321.1 histidine kinase [Rhizobium sp. VS19-DR96]MBZ5768972.1 histidine kinase [Rhizobium sp. VS19-DR129.2]MBZ5775901.1 histidine kinase [Rhizobium sp. VS19-DRK62.2]MBZ5786335.1 histidine kinase [Rhizobium sp. VS19-DR121]MBZ5804329.1 histidine kinase [Rhizobium sp. VS19-DR181]